MARNENPTATTDPATISIEGLTKIYNADTPDAVEAIRDVDLHIDDGEFISIVGPSGCGKSTVLKILAGLVPKTDGAIKVDGSDVNEPIPEIGLVFQESSLYPWRTVQKNAEFGLEIMGVNKDERRKRAQEMIDLVGVSGFEDAYPDELSGGMQKRIALARTLASDPDIMLMDEPFGALDEQTRIFMGEELLRIWKETEKTVVFVTHSLQEAVLLSDRVAVMTNRPGQIAEEIPIDIDRPRDTEVMNTEEFQTAQSEIWEIIKAESNRVLQTQQ